MNSAKCVGLNTITASYQIDHLAVVCMIMDIPLLFVDFDDYQFGKKYYPKLDAQHADYHEFSPDYLIANYDVLFMSDVVNRHEFHEQYHPLEQRYGKQIRHVFCPHGFSDKSFYFKACGDEDIVLVYGQNMLDMLSECHVLDKMNAHVIVGNYRYSYYLQNKEFYDKLAEDEVWSQFAKRQPTILYAPTWRDQENSTTFFEATAQLLDHLPADYNMLIKLHPRLELDGISEYYSIIGKYESGNVVFIKDFPPVFPLLAGSDIYIGDMSSVGYDFLAFNRPMFFLNKEARGTYLHRCGIAVDPDEYSKIFKIIDSSLASDQANYSAIRKQVYDYSFAANKSFEEIREQIKVAFSKKY